MRPRVLELAGVPASGKTTTARLLGEWLADAGERPCMFREAAEIAPFPDDLKDSWRFNAWTLCDAVSNAVRLAASTDTHITVFDRGLFDAVCWSRWHLSRGNLDEATAASLEAFALAPAWYSSIDLVVVLEVKFETALVRRGGDEGRIFNRRTFTELEDAYRRVAAEHCLRQRPRLVTIETDALTPNEVFSEVRKLILDC